MDDEGRDVLESVIILFTGLIGFGFFAFYGVIVAIVAFTPWILFGLYGLIASFIRYQWPNRYEYIDFWRMHWTR